MSVCDEDGIMREETARNPTPRRRLCNAKTSPTCTPWHLLNLALASSPYLSSRITVRPYSSAHRPTPWMSDFVARFVEINVPYSRSVPRARTISEHFIVNFVFTKIVATLNLCTNLNLSFFYHTQLYLRMYTCTQNHRRRNQKNPFGKHAPWLREKRVEVVSNRLVEDFVIRFFTGNFLWQFIHCRTFLRVWTLIQTCPLYVNCENKFKVNVWIKTCLDDCFVKFLSST